MGLKGRDFDFLGWARFIPRTAEAKPNVKNPFEILAGNQVFRPLDRSDGPPAWIRLWNSVIPSTDLQDGKT